jgi:hypothetical protein
MKRHFLSLLLCFVSLTATSQIIGTMEAKEPIDGVCKQDKIYAMLIFDGQKEAICPLTKDEILERLNSEVSFLKDNLKHRDKGMINIIINCNGEVVKCKIDNNTKSKLLDQQIEKVFNSLGEWKAGKLNGKEVDSVMLFSFKIKKGKFTFS